MSRNNEESIRAYVLLKIESDDTFVNHIVDEAMNVLMTKGMITMNQVDAIIDTYYPTNSNIEWHYP